MQGADDVQVNFIVRLDRAMSETRQVEKEAAALPAGHGLERRLVIPALKKEGGYWCSSDHSAPDSVSLETFREFVRLAKELGAY
ncbi:MAG: hypothetical protein HY360_06110 [Verrucomicrobia bacterium]|nr:hypothetical protein [Verrucomicrobiota bacterium]